MKTKQQLLIRKKQMEKLVTLKIKKETILLLQIAKGRLGLKTYDLIIKFLLNQGGIKNAV